MVLPSRFDGTDLCPFGFRLIDERLGRSCEGEIGIYPDQFVCDGACGKAEIPGRLVPEKASDRVFHIDAGMPHHFKEGTPKKRWKNLPPPDART